MGDYYRHEDKYQIWDTGIVQMLPAIQCVMRPDPHASREGLYLIRSIYFDDIDQSNLAANAAGTDLRDKWRIRMYNNDPTVLFLERKSKENGMIHKDSCLITRDQYNFLVSNDTRLPDLTNVPPLYRRFVLLRARFLYQPQIIVQYERRPFIFGPGNVRVTFDRNIAAGTDLKNFFDPELSVRPILPTGEHLLEVKYDAFLPDVLRGVIQQGSMQRITFSKYALCMGWQNT